DMVARGHQTAVTRLHVGAAALGAVGIEQQLISRPHHHVSYVVAAGIPSAMAELDEGIDRRVACGQQLLRQDTARPGRHAYPSRMADIRLGTQATVAELR